MNSLMNPNESNAQPEPIEHEPTVDMSDYTDDQSEDGQVVTASVTRTLNPYPHLSQSKRAALKKAWQGARNARKRRSDDAKELAEHRRRATTRRSPAVRRASQHTARPQHFDFHDVEHGEDPYAAYF